MAPRRTPEKAAATRESLIDAGLDVFSERGYSAAQLEEIAARARVTRGALYHHFGNKAVLYLAVLAERWPIAMQPLWRTLEGSGPSRERVRAFVAGFLTALERDRTTRALLKLSMDADGSLPELRGGLRTKARALEAWVDGLARAIATDHKPVAARQAAVAVVAFLQGVTLLSTLAPSLVSPARDAARLAAACVDGALG
ncbi:MAG TPA: TetR family transcriptional regulator [Kofleriaceae bacterium]|nr:TetR family transcriptional regulator [Kofleriaceae bacterium]